MDTLDILFEIAETSWDGLWLVDLDGEIVRANHAARQTAQVDPVGVPMARFLRPEDQPVVAGHLQSIRAGSALARGPFVGTLTRTDGSTARVTIHESVFYDETGRPAGLLQRLVDTSRGEDVRSAQRASRVRLTPDQIRRRAGFWEWDRAAGIMSGSEELMARFGHVEGFSTLMTKDAFEGVHPHDRANVHDAFRRALHDGEHDIAWTMRLQLNGEWRWFCTRAHVDLDADGRVSHIRGTLADVEDTVATEIALRDRVAQNELMHAVTAAANGAETLDDLLRLGAELVLVHDDWTRGIIFKVHDGELEPWYADEAARLADDDMADEVAFERELAQRTLATREMLWDDEQRLSLAVPVWYAGVIRVVVVVTSEPPLHRHAMAEELALHMAMQAERLIEREETAAALTRARDDAMAASHKTSRFLATMAHELRTPLTGVLGLNELLLDTDLDPDQRRLAERVERSGLALKRLIDDTLDLSKAQAGRLVLESVEFDVRSVLDAALAPTAERMRGGEVELRAEYDDVPELLVGDPIRLTQVVANLLGNAVKFTPKGSVTVRVACTPEGDTERLLCEVVDTGIGIAATAPDLFNPYEQAEQSTTRNFGGTGLGLAICREIVEAMGGQIGYDSEPGKGTRFHFAVDLGRVPDASRLSGAWPD